MAVLTDEQDPLVVIERDDADGTGMHLVVPGHDLAAGQLHSIGAHSPAQPVEPVEPFDDRLRVGGVGEVTHSAAGSPEVTGWASD